MEWQPIETAPKDDWIIGTDGETVAPIKWEEDRDDGGHVGWCGASSWVGGVLYYYHSEAEFEPTLWMPLPAPPKE